MEELVEYMKRVLGSSFALYLKAHNYHWNVTGPNFAQYHDFLGDLYEEIHSSIDDTAEEIRKLGSFAPGSFARFAQLSVVQDEVNIPAAQQMMSNLAADNDKLLSLMYDAREAAEKANKAGTLDYLESRIGVHEKHAWMLKAFNQ